MNINVEKRTMQNTQPNRKTQNRKEQKDIQNETKMRIKKEEKKEKYQGHLKVKVALP